MLLGAGIADRASAITIVCDGTACARGGNTCLISCGSTGTCTVTNAYSAPAGCRLDFGDRDVVFKNTFDVGSATLAVRARSITVQGQLMARSDDEHPGGTLELIAEGRGGQGGAIVVSGRLDATGRRGGAVRMRATDAVDVRSGAALVANGNATSADGGSITIDAGTSVRQSGTVSVTGGNQGAGGAVTVRAATILAVSQAIVATGGAGDGGDVDLAAGDDLTIAKPIDVSSTNGGSGGSISAAAGMDTLGGTKTGGALAVTALLKADGSSDADGGYDGGDIALTAAGPISVSGAIHAVGSAPDGAGGSLSVDASDTQLNVVTPLDGDVVLSGPITLTGASADGDGGGVAIDAGRSLTITSSAPIDVSGSDGGDVTATSGRHLSVSSAVSAGAGATTGGGGAIALVAGMADGTGVLTIAGNIDAHAGPRGLPQDQAYGGCSVAIQKGVAISGNGGTERGAQIDIASPGVLTIGSNVRVTASPAGTIVLTHRLPADVAGTSTFDPPPLDRLSTVSALYPACPVCGDGVVQPGEACDPGSAADGSCCNASCSASTCPASTPDPTASPGDQPTTPDATPTVRPTTTATTTPAGLVTATPRPLPSVLPIVAPATLIACERAISRASAAFGDAYGDAQRCALAALSCLYIAPSESARVRCVAAVRQRCSMRATRAEQARSKSVEQIERACGGTPPRIPTEILRAPSGLAFELLEPTCRNEADLSPTSLGAITACLETVIPCGTGRALATGVPRAGDLLGAVLGLDVSALCMTADASRPITPADDGIDALHCQRAIAAGTSRILRQHTSALRRCTDALFACRSTGRATPTCSAIAHRCEERLRATTQPSTAHFVGTVDRACTVTPTTLLSSDGLGFDERAERCARVGIPYLRDATDVAACVMRTARCDAIAAVQNALPFVTDEFQRFGIAIADPFCVADEPGATATPSTAPTPTSIGFTASPTPVRPPPSTVTPGATVPAVTPSPTPSTADSEPSPAPSPGASAVCGDGVIEAGEQCDFGDAADGDGCSRDCQFELLVPGGGPRDRDCAAEWAVINPDGERQLGRDGLPATVQLCVDGDPSCDADGVIDGECHFRVATCFGLSDPRLPDCAATTAVTRITLQIPRPAATPAPDPARAANAVALLEAIRAFGSVAPGGRHGNVFVYDPPLSLASHAECTATADLVVPLRGAPEQHETVRVMIERVAGASTVRERDRDTLRLTCVRP